MLIKLLQLPCSGVLFEHFEQCLNVMHCFVCCPNSVQTCYPPFPCIQTLFKQFVLVWQCSNTSNSVQTVFRHVILPFHVFEQPAVRWCAVQTLFKQFVLVWQCSNTSNSVRTARSCPLTMVSPSFFSFLSPFLFFFVYSHSHLPASASTHAHPQHVHTPIHPLRTPVSLFFFFFFFLVQTPPKQSLTKPEPIPGLPAIHLQHS